MSVHSGLPVNSELSEGAHASGVRHHRRWHIGVLLGIGVLINYFDRVNISVSHGALVQEFHISEVTFGVLAMNFATQLAAIAAPIATGYFAGKDDFPAAFTVAAVILCVGILVYILLLGRMHVIPEPQPAVDPT